MAEVERRRRFVMDEVDEGRGGEVIPLFRPPLDEVPGTVNDEELALLVACGATIEQIARRLGRDLEQVYRDLVSLKLALDEE
jgi:hypothetical protein